MGAWGFLLPWFMPVIWKGSQVLPGACPEPSSPSHAVCSLRQVPTPLTPLQQLKQRCSDTKGSHRYCYCLQSLYLKPMLTAAWLKQSPKCSSTIPFHTWNNGCRNIRRLFKGIMTPERLNICTSLKFKINTHTKKKTQKKVRRNRWQRLVWGNSWHRLLGHHILENQRAQVRRLTFTWVCLQWWSTENTTPSTTFSYRYVLWVLIMLLVGKDRLDLKGLEINKVRKHSLEVTLQLRSILLSAGRWAIISTWASGNSTTTVSQVRILTLPHTHCTEKNSFLHLRSTTRNPALHFLRWDTSDASFPAGKQVLQH